MARSQFWTTSRVRILNANAHLSASKVAAKIGDGCTRNAVIAKRNRLKGIVFPSDIAAGRLTPEQQKRRREAMIVRDQKVVALRVSGSTYEAIAASVGLSTCRVWRIVNAA